MHRSFKNLLASALPLLWLSIGACENPAPVAQEGTLPVGNGVTLSYSVLGDGADTVVVLHGGPGLHSRYLVDAVRPLLPGHTFILYDQRGRGRSSPAPDSLITIGDDVRDLEAIRAHFRLERVSLIAHDWGAILASLYARQYPQHVTRMMLVSPSVPRMSELFAIVTTYPHDSALGAAHMEAIERHQDSLAPIEYCQRFWGFSFSPTEVTDRSTIEKLSGPMCDAPAAALLRAPHVGYLVRLSLRNFNLTDTLKGLAMPVLVVQGDGPEAIVGSARSWAVALGDAREVLLSSPTLFPWLRDTRAYARAGRAFLDGHWPDGALNPAGATARQPAGAGEQGS